MRVTALASMRSGIDPAQQRQLDKLTRQAVSGTTFEAVARELHTTKHSGMEPALRGPLDRAHGERPVPLDRKSAADRREAHGCRARAGRRQRPDARHRHLRRAAVDAGGAGVVGPTVPTARQHAADGVGGT